MDWEKSSEKEKVEYSLSLLWKEYNILETDLSQEEKRTWERAVKSLLAGDCVTFSYKEGSRYPIIEYNVPKPVLTMEELQDEVENLKKEVDKLKRNDTVTEIKKRRQVWKKV